MVWLREVVRGGETAAARRAASDFAGARRASGWSCTERAGRQAVLPGRAARADGAARGAQGGKRFCQGAPHERMEPHGTRRAASDFAGARCTSGWSCAGRDAQGGFAHSRQNFTWKRTAQGARRGRPPCAGERAGAARASVAGSRGTGEPEVQAGVRGVERNRCARDTGRRCGVERNRRARGTGMRCGVERNRRARGTGMRCGVERDRRARGTGRRSRDQKGGDALGAPPPAKSRCRSRRVTRAPAAAARARSAPAPTRPSLPTRRAAAGNCRPTAARCRR